MESYVSTLRFVNGKWYKASLWRFPRHFILFIWLIYLAWNDFNKNNRDSEQPHAKQFPTFRNFRFRHKTWRGDCSPLAEVTFNVDDRMLLAEGRTLVLQHAQTLAAGSSAPWWMSHAPLAWTVLTGFSLVINTRHCDVTERMRGTVFLTR